VNVDEKGRGGGEKKREEKRRGSTLRWLSRCFRFLLFLLPPGRRRTEKPRGRIWGVTTRRKRREGRKEGASLVDFSTRPALSYARPRRTKREKRVQGGRGEEKREGKRETPSSLPPAWCRVEGREKKGVSKKRGAGEERRGGKNLASISISAFSKREGRGPRERVRGRREGKKKGEREGAVCVSIAAHEAIGREKKQKGRGREKRGGKERASALPRVSSRRAREEKERVGKKRKGEKEEGEEGKDEGLESRSSTSKVGPRR